jgi:hypothetical protein
LIFCVRSCSSVWLSRWLLALYLPVWATLF